MLVITTLTVLFSNYAYAATQGESDLGALGPSSPNSGSVTVTQPPIIPTGSTAAGEIMIPHQTESTNQSDYLRNSLLPNLTSIVIGLTGGLGLVFMIIAGIQILTAYGDTTKVQAAQKTATYAIIGIILAMLSYAIVAIISAIKV
jgi:hypothetical protein